MLQESHETHLKSLSLKTNVDTVNSLVSHRAPTNPYGHEQVWGLTQVPPFSHGNLHKAAQMEFWYFYYLS